ncbi:hypothetical protein HAX54_018458 [Datura stramonium]|uniref:Uncharacterized protein n=1 Tax=Datura stramonium TaxID=4076 RepID=A0ABS8Y8E7_DATST|nr:hypothetical protein [Datura stramonium]
MSRSFRPNRKPKVKGIASSLSAPDIETGILIGVWSAVTELGSISPGTPSSLTGYMKSKPSKTSSTP